MIPRERLCNLIDIIRAEAGEDLTYFEFSTVLALVHFYLEGVDIAVLEVGLGGRLDATNLVTPEVSVITNISLEHTDYLGGDINSIAREKGGIIKKNGMCVTAVTQPSVIDVLEKICLKERARLFRYGRDMKIRKKKGGKIFYYGIGKTYSNLNLPLVGEHQVRNASLALAVVEVLSSGGLNIDDDAVSEGMRDVKWEGRLEMLSHNPRIVVDGAHNPAGISALCRSLTADFSYERLICIFGVLSDKDWKGMLRRLTGVAHHIILTSLRMSRAVTVDELDRVAEKLGVSCESIPEASMALERACSLAGKNDLICVTGSIYLVGEIKKSSRFDLL
jgi:dihydrofolate synthase/folylpolyglutamate synthase